MPLPALGALLARFGVGAAAEAATGAAARGVATRAVATETAQAAATQQAKQQVVKKSFGDVAAKKVDLAGEMRKVLQSQPPQPAASSPGPTVKVVTEAAGQARAAVPRGQVAPHPQQVIQQGVQPPPVQLPLKNPKMFGDIMAGKQAMPGTTPAPQPAPQITPRPAARAAPEKAPSTSIGRHLGQVIQDAMTAAQSLQGNRSAPQSPRTSSEPTMARGASSGPAAAPAGTSTRAAEVLSQGSNFGDILSGKTSMAEAEEDLSQQERRAAADADAAKAAEDSAKMLKKLAFTASGSIIAMLGLPKATRALGASMVEYREHFQDVNGVIAAATQRLEAQRFQREVSLASRTQGSAARLMESQSRLEEALLPFRAAVDNIGANVVSRFADLITVVTRGVEALPGMRGVLEKIAGEQERRAVPWADFISDIAEGKWEVGQDGTRRKAKIKD